MGTAYVADTGIFVRCGGTDNEKHRRLQKALQETGTKLLIPPQVYEELGGDPAAEEYPSGGTRWRQGIKEGWIEVRTLDYSAPVVAKAMDAATRFIASETNRKHDEIEKADGALAGLAAQLLDTGEADTVVLLTTDKPAGCAAETILPRHGFRGQIEYRYVSNEYTENLSTDDFTQ